MSREELVRRLYQDYRLWCDANGIPHDTWEVFYNTLNREETPVIDPEEYRRQNPTPARRYNPWHMALDPSQKPFTKLPEPLQPNDEDRAVAEAIRILGGNTNV